VEEKVKAPAKKLNVKKLLTDYNGLMIMIVLLLVCFLGISGFSKSAYQVPITGATYGLITIGMALVMITGNIDLSVGYLAGACAVFSILAINVTGNIWVGLVAALIFGAIGGAINGTLVTKIGVSPLIATIAMNYIYKGVTYSQTNNGSLQISYGDSDTSKALKKALKAVTKNGVLSDYITISVIIFIVLLVVTWFVLTKTDFGNSLYIAGDNAEAGSLAGIPITRISWLAYLICGALCGLGGYFMSSYDGCASYLQGSGVETLAISAAVIGGIKMSGGKGRTMNIVIGIVIMRSITVMLNVLKVPSSWMDLVSGLLLIAVLALDHFTSTNKED
jgi:ribose transport system permease protein